MAQQSYQLARHEEELDRLWKEAKERKHYEPVKQAWEPWPTQAAYQADMALCFQLGLTNHLLNPTNEKTYEIVKPYRDALNKAFKLGKTSFIDPSEIEGVRPSFWPYESEQDYLVDHQLLRLIGMQLNGIEKMSPAEIHAKCAIWRDAYQAGAEKASRDAAPEPQQEPEVVDQGLVDKPAMQAVAADIDSVTKPQPPQERQKSLIKRLLG
ncbi:MAG: hypothetical protein ACDS79_07965 [Enterobacteriaceae bacterium]